MIRRTLISALFLTLPLSSQVCAQQKVDLTREQRLVVIDSITSALNRGYVFPEVATRMAADLRARFGKGEFDNMSDGSEFAQTLTTDLQAISHDKHLRVRVRADNPSSGPAGSFGVNTNIFGKTERMPGDIAYVQILSFIQPPDSILREETTRVMSAVADAKALIIDLRSNGGGSPFTVALVSSYLFGSDPVHLSVCGMLPPRSEDEQPRGSIVARTANRRPVGYPAAEVAG